MGCGDSYLFLRVFLVTVHNPVCTDTLSLEGALYGSFLPIPSNDLFPLSPPEAYSKKSAPGAVIVRREPIVLNQGREKVVIKVTNTGDRPVQVCLSMGLLFSS